MKIRILLLLLLFSTTLLASDLESVVSDLSKLSRITNAIALQNSVLQKTLNLSEVVTELLGVKQEYFDALMDLNTTFVTAEYEKFNETITRMKPTPKLVNKSILRKFRNSMQFLNYSMENFREIKENGQSYRANKIIDLLKKPKSEYPELPCKTETLSALTNFYELFSERKKVDSHIGKEYALRAKELQEDIVSCFARCQKFKEEARDEVYEEFTKMKAAFTLADVLDDYGRDFETLDNFSGILANMTSDIGRTHGLDQLPHKIGVLIRSAIFASLDIADDKHLTIPALISGFPGGFGDLSKVPGDLESPWFKKHVSRGKSTKLLVLNEFYKLAEHLAKLQEPWNYLINKTNVMDIEDGGIEAIKTLVMIEDFPETKKAQELVKSSEKQFSKCWPIARAINRTLTRSIIKAYHLPAQVLNDMNHVVEMADAIGHAIELHTFSTAFKKLMKRIPQTDLFYESEFQFYIWRVQDDPVFPIIKPVIEKMMALFKAQNDYIDVYRKLQNAQNNSTLAFQKDTFHLNATLTDSNLESFIDCLKAEQFDTEGLAQTERFLSEIQYAEKDSEKEFKIVHEFLKRVGEIKWVLENSPLIPRQKPSRFRRQATVTLPESRTLSLHFSEGLEVIRRMVHARAHRAILLNFTQYSKELKKRIRDKTEETLVYEFWMDPGIPVNRTLKGMDTLNGFATTINLDLKSIREIFKEAEKVPGITMYREVVKAAKNELQKEAGVPEFQKAISNTEELEKWNLDFANSKKSLGAAYVVVGSLSNFFDEVFGFKKPPQHVIIEPSVPYWTVIGLCFGFFAMCILVGFIGYGLTKSGRSKYYETYLYYFPNQKEFEKRWRYSLFMDRENGQNALIDASREINAINVKNILERGAYVNVYSPFGNTALHMATKRGFPKVVELLIRNGADRSLLNAQNLIAEHTIPHNYRETRKEEAAKYEEIERIYGKYRNKKFRIRVPQEMASHLFHIYIDSRTENTLTNAFTEKYPGITSDEPLPTTTHCICKTSDSGVLETDDVNLLAWIFLGVIMVRESWMADCVRDDKMIRRDDKHLIDDVRFNGTLYQNCVRQWSQAMAKGTMPYLYGAYFVFVMKDLTRVPTLTMIINTLGGVFLEEFPAKEVFNAGSCPYLHSNLGPAFVIHDGQTDLSAYNNDKTYSLFTEQQFIGFLLKRDIHQDTNPNPIPQLAE